jgi:hypothetical protein
MCTITTPFTNKTISALKAFTKALIPLLHPIIVEYNNTTTTICGHYNTPSITLLQDVPIMYLNKQYIGGTTEGLFNPNDVVIAIAIKNRTIMEVVETVTHELMHFIQFYNVGETFTTVYHNEASLKGYNHNVFEAEAKTLTFAMQDAWYYNGLDEAIIAAFDQV